MNKMILVLSVLALSFGMILLTFGNDAGIVGVVGGLIGMLYLDKTENNE